MSADLKAAHTLLQKGVRATKTGLFQWKPDWHTAASAFDQASSQYRRLGEDAFLVDALLLGADAYEELSSFNTAARLLGEAITVLCKKGFKDDRQHQIASYAERAAHLYRANGQVDKAAQTLVSAAKTAGRVENHIATALQFYKQACDMYVEESRELLSVDTFKEAVSFCVRQKRLAEAIEFLKKASDVLDGLDRAPNRNKCYLGILVLLLELGQRDKAEAVVDTFNASFATSDDYEAFLALLRAIDSQDDDAFVAAKKHPSFKYMDNQIARVVKKLAIDRGQAGASADTVGEEEEVDLT